MSILKPDTGPIKMFFCPGCKYSHSIDTSERVVATDQRWTWNGSEDAPTFHPSINEASCRWPGKEDEAEYDAVLAKGFGAAIASRFGTRCHTWVRDGMIEFLGDCTHHLKGQTVPIPKWADRRK